HFGGKVSPQLRKEYGETLITIDQDSRLFDGLQDKKQEVLMSHGDTVETLPDGFRTIAWSDGVIAGVSNETQNIYGIQFEPEVDLTVNGKQMLSNFLRKIAHIADHYSLDNRIDNAINYIRNKVGDNPVIVLVSGGVDSAVSASLLV